MAALKGVVVRGPIVPADDADVYPTHHACYGRGGFCSVADVTERNAIPTERRSDGMLVHQRSDNGFWQLRGGTANSNWVQLDIVAV